MCPGSQIYESNRVPLNPPHPLYCPIPTPTIPTQLGQWLTTGSKLRHKNKSFFFHMSNNDRIEKSQIAKTYCVQPHYIFHIYIMYYIIYVIYIDIYYILGPISWWEYYHLKLLLTGSSGCNHIERGKFAWNYRKAEKEELRLLFPTVSLDKAHMGQILQDGENVCFMSNFF